MAAAARAAFTARDRLADIADVTHDSLDDATSDPSRRSVTFHGADTTISVTQVDDVLLIAVEPELKASLDVESRRAEAPRAAQVAPARWEVRPVPNGPVSFLVVADGLRVRTAWTLW